MDPLSDFSNFRSAIEWPEMRPVSEEATGEMKPLSAFTASAIDSMALAFAIAPSCESPIEIELGAQLCKVIRSFEGLSLQPQFSLGPYRYDFAIVDEHSGLPIALIECDGREYHETEEQRANDRAKDDFATKERLLLFRFSGAEIYRDAQGCVSSIFKKLQSRGIFSREEWAAIESLLPTPRPYEAISF
jgi:very-short-patch-repair endonuclease